MNKEQSDLAKPCSLSGLRTVIIDYFKLKLDLLLGNCTLSDSLDCFNKVQEQCSELCSIKFFDF